jgi:basic amino acid/polyamine antiporter, APA family
MFSLPVEHWYRLIAWMAIGFVIYFLYGYHHSELRKRDEEFVPAKAVQRR